MRELWSDAIATGTAVAAAALRRGDFEPASGDIWLAVRGGSRVGPGNYPFAYTQGKGHAGRIVDWHGEGTVLTLDGNVNDTWTEVGRHVEDPELVGVIGHALIAGGGHRPGAEAIAEHRRLTDMQTRR